MSPQSRDKHCSHQLRQKETNLGINAALATDYQGLREIYVHKSEVEKAKTLIKEAFPETN